ncbi:MAG TPA: cysteine synthase family protein [Myxococcota bacterium]|nr:cysteine synthase family protein [Myxococcota bacterium]
MSIAKIAKENILLAIGNTPIVSLQPLAPDLSVNLYGKCEFLNPAGSIKDRIALHMINEAEKKGILKKGGTIVEATSGNTGLGLAMVASLRGYTCIFVMADKQSLEKRKALEALGAKVVVCPTDVAADDERSYYKVAERIARTTPNCFYASQYDNKDNPQAHYLYTGPEIYEQCGNSLDYLVLGIGTGGTVSGIARYIKPRNERFQIIGVDPIGSLYFDLFYHDKMITPHSYLIEGIGEDFVPKTMDLKSIDHIVQVEDEESFHMGRRLVRELGILAGASSGAAVLGAIKYFRKNPCRERKNVLVILVDSSTRYLSKYLNDAWMIEQGFSLS